MKKLVPLLTFIVVVFFSYSQNVKNVPDASFNTGWLFFKGEAKGAENPEFNDSEWRKLNLPHDWAIEGPFSDKYNARTGGLPVHGTGWYRKHFTVPEEMKGKQVAIEFDGAMSNAHIWLNGKFVGKRPYGYISFELDLTPYVRFGEKNIIAVRLQPEDLAMRWYPGAGIYRNVYIKYNNPVHISPWGTYLTTTEINEEMAEVKVVTNVKNTASNTIAGVLKTTVLDKQGRAVASVSSNMKLTGGSVCIIDQHLKVNNPNLWNLESAYLYKAISEVIINGNIYDVYETEFGIRSIKFTSNNGFLLNGERIQFKGVCMHHDLGPLGAAFNYRARERQMEIMKSMGVNALRTSHNPPSPDWLKICDRLGILVVVEAFDEWKIGKVPNGYNQHFDQWHEQDLRDMIRRDRNHPSVIMWSIGNEILEQGREDGWKLAKHLNDICHDEDPTRPTTAGFNYFPAPFKNKLAFQIDVVGMNYWPLKYKELKDRYPEMIVYGAETSSQTSSRGVYHLPLSAKPQKETGHVSSYDVIVGPPWAYPPDVEWDAQEAEPASLGEFVWTGFDYLGEPTPYGGRDNSTNGYWNDDWPSHSSYFAPVDLCGFPKDRYYLYQSQWTDEPMVHVLPHWNWPGSEGDLIPVFAYTNCEEVELFVNGKSFGKKVKGKDLTMIPAEFNSFEKGEYPSKYRLSWKVPYQAGTLKVVAFKNGDAVAEKTIKTAGKPHRIILEADRNEIKADNNDLSFLTVKIEDEKGNFCPLADNMIEFEITGQGVLAGVCNGNQRDTTSFKQPRKAAFNGMCLAVIKSIPEAGQIQVKATAAGLEPASIYITTIHL